MICCVTGHRPWGFPFDYENQKGVLFKMYQAQLTSMVQELIEQGYTEFISGMTQGADLDFAETVIKCRKNHSFPFYWKLQFLALIKQKGGDSMI